MSTYRRLAQFARPEARRIAALYGIGLVATPLALLTPLPLKLAVDSGLGDEPLPGLLEALVPGSAAPGSTGVLLVAATLFVVVALLSQLQQLASAALGAIVGERLLLAFRAQLFRQAQRLSLSYHDQRGAAESTYRIQYDAMSIQWIVTNGLAPLVTSLLTIAAMVVVTAMIDWQLVVVALCVAPVLVALSHVYRRRLKAGWREAKALESSAVSIVQEVLGGLRVVKAFGQEDREEERFLRTSNEGMRARVRMSVVEGVFALLIGVTTALGTAAVLYVGARHVQSGRLTLGELLLVMGYLSMLYSPLQSISRTFGRLQASVVSAERVFAVLDEEPDVEECANPRPLVRARGAVKFRAVSFGYGERAVFEDVTFGVPAGSSVAVTGATGAGKTTLISLLMRFYDPTSGAVMLDDVDLREYRVADLRNQFALVLQEPVLFSTTVRENIAYARPEASMAEIVAAARAANADGFIRRLSSGYGTRLGERGLTLSGGERQRISIARAFLKDAPVLILDEPTSAVDLITESSIVEAIERLTIGRTTFFISHRPSTIRNCQLRLDLEDGRLRRSVRRQRILSDSWVPA